MSSFDVKKGVGGVVIFLNDRLDTTSVMANESVILDIVENNNNVVFDCKNLHYCSSAGLRLLLQAQKKMSGRGIMKVINVSDAVYEIFAVTGFTDILNIQ